MKHQPQNPVLRIQATNQTTIIRPMRVHAVLQKAASHQEDQMLPKTKNRSAVRQRREEGSVHAVRPEGPNHPEDPVRASSPAVPAASTVRDHHPLPATTTNHNHPVSTTATSHNHPLSTT